MYIKTFVKDGSTAIYPQAVKISAD